MKQRLSLKLGLARLAVVSGLVVACESGTEYAPPGAVNSDEPGHVLQDPTRSAGEGGAPALGDGDGDSPGDGDTPGDGDEPGRGDTPFTYDGGPATGPDDPIEGPPLCREDSAWGEATALDSFNTGATETLLDITPDERVIVFSRGGAVKQAKRASAEDPWPSPEPLMLPPSLDASLGLALTPDGLSLVAVLQEGLGFALLTRSKLEDSFVLDESTLGVDLGWGGGGGAPGQDDHLFSLINRTAELSPITLSHPVISDDGGELWWVEDGGDSAIYMGTWEEESPIARHHVGCDERGSCDYLLDGYADFFYPISGVSADRRTIFMDFEPDGSSMMFRDYVAITAPFFDEIPLFERKQPQTNAACTRLYYSMGGDLFFDTLIE